MFWGLFAIYTPLAFPYYGKHAFYICDFLSILQVSSVSKINSSTNSQHPFVTKANNGLKINPAPELPAFGNASNNVNGGSSKSKISLPQNVPRSAGSMQYAQPQTAKPSGLRMPSPSLSFFNQVNSHGLFQIIREMHSLWIIVKCYWRVRLNLLFYFAVKGFA